MTWHGPYGHGALALRNAAKRGEAERRTDRTAPEDRAQFRRDRAVVQAHVREARTDRERAA
jgi:hypothetical protein